MMREQIKLAVNSENERRRLEELAARLPHPTKQLALFVGRTKQVGGGTCAACDVARRLTPPGAQCQKLPASKPARRGRDHPAGRHHLGTMGGIISVCPGDFLGIRNQRGSRTSTPCERVGTAPAGHLPG